MQALIPIGWQDIIGQSIDWLHRYVLVPAFLAQVICLLVLLGIDRWRARHSRRCSILPRRRQQPALSHRRGTGPRGEMVSSCCSCVVRTPRLQRGRQSRRSAAAGGKPVLVWVLIRLSSMLVRDERLARAVAVLAWIIAALNIAGLITPVVELLDAMAVPIGNFRVSLLLVLKGAVTLAVFVWIANVMSRLVDQRLRISRR